MGFQGDDEKNSDLGISGFSIMGTFDVALTYYLYAGYLRLVGQKYLIDCNSSNSERELNVYHNREIIRWVKER